MIALGIREEDELISVRLTNGSEQIIVGTKKGLSIRFNETDVRSMGRTATGVKAITLSIDDDVVGMGIIEEDTDILIVTNKGYGKRTPVDEYHIQTRGGKGIKTCHLSEKNGEMVSLRTVKEDEDLMIITQSGIIIRTAVTGISKLGRNTMGVKLIRMGEGDEVATVARIQKEEEQDSEIESNGDQEGLNTENNTEE